MWRSKRRVPKSAKLGAKYACGFEVVRFDF
jgi:hypothetical protein